MDYIRLRGVRTHNLANIDLDLPRDRLIVLTGLSGSGKSSLAFDTLYAEGQRRYVESLSAYARQFLSVMEKPDLDLIEGLSPAISIEQKTTSHNPRSTVGTITEIHDYLRLLFARVGQPRCPEHGEPLDAMTVSQMVDQVLALPEGTPLMLLAPVTVARKGDAQRLLGELHAQGFVRARIDGRIHELDTPPALDPKRKHDIAIVVDRFRVRPELAARLAESFETALKLSGGVARVLPLELTGADAPSAPSAPPPLTFSARFACPVCGYSLPELEPRLFSFNNPAGACPACDGLGVEQFVDPDKVAADPRFSPDGGAAQSVAERLRNLERRYRETDSSAVREELARYLASRPCPACQGARLNPAACQVRVGGQTLPALSARPVGETRRWFEQLVLPGQRGAIGARIVAEIAARLRFLTDVGLDYLTLDRRAETLSGGEAQRIRLASQIGAGLVGVMYILDEPSIGLHQRDNARLLATLTRLRDLGNTVIVVEHDEEAIRAADRVIDLGPGAGLHGGRIVAQGTADELAACPESLTGQYLSGARRILVPARRVPSDPARQLIIQGARGNNLRELDVSIPVGTLCCVTGVSGSGKSTLINDTLFPAIARHLHGAGARPAPHDAIQGLEHFDKIVAIDQSPIGRTPRSNPATYTGLFGPVRELFAAVPEARARGYGPGRFSFNVKGGRCEACQGDGLIRVEMHFLPDIHVRCEVCQGRRYNRETLEIRYQGRTIHEVLELTVEDALVCFDAIPPVRRKLQTLLDVGLGYVRLGQSATTLSGGEAQRVKLSRELGKRDTGRTLYLLDEPTTGLHFHDVSHLLAVLHRLRDQGNTVVVIEHNLDVIKTADWILDLGPEGGDRGGELIASGTPEQIAAEPRSYTGQFLRPLLARGW